MILKVVVLFLAAMGIMAMFGKLFRPPGKPGGRQARMSGGRCPSCGAPRVGTGSCPCGAPGPTSKQTSKNKRS